MSGDIIILLATYDGASYLSEQLDSIFNQTIQGWHLIVRDDCSNDSTFAILNFYQQKYLDRITIISNKAGQLGACQNFGILLECAEAQYMMFCDQDDVWLPNKIELALKEMRRLEAKFGTKHPILIHTDAQVVGIDLKVKANSFWQYQHVDPVEGVNFNRLLVQNVVTGCTVMINRALRDIALPIPSQAIMHDWWLALVASAFGAIGHVSAPTLLYRQHCDNQVGAGEDNFRTLLKRLWRGAAVNQLILQTQSQAAVLLDIYHDRLSPYQKEVLTVYSNLQQFGFFLRRYYRLKYSFLYARLVDNLGRMILG